MPDERETFNNSAQLNEHGLPTDFDVAEYIEDLESLPMTEEQKAELLRTLWDIMSAFARWGFGVDSVIPLLAQNSLESGRDQLQEAIPTHEFNVAAEEITAEKDGPT